MVTLWIDGRRCDINQLPTIPIGFDITKLTKAEGGRSGRSIELELPTTPNNDTIFGASCDLYATQRFNMEHHTARIEKDGVEIFGGTAYLLSTTVNRELGGGYKIRISEGGAEWIESLVYGHLSDLQIPFSAKLNLGTIESSWRGEQAVRFLPVYRGGYIPHTSSSSALPTERIMLTDDYHPFVSIAEMVKAMFAESGYTLHSNFFDSEFAHSLYMSGDYARTNNSYAKERCDFFARRAAAGSASADFMGRVYTSTAFAEHSIGSIVDTANPEATDSSGEVMYDTFCNHNSFSKNSAGNICFTPKVSVKAGFLLHLEYTTEYKILSREQFTGFDVVEGLHGERIEVSLANTCRDFRGKTTPNTQYRALVFDHVEGRQYQLSATQTDNLTLSLGSWSTRSTIITTPATNLASTNLYYRDGSDDAWKKYSGDWALYAGYIEECGMVDVEMDFRIAPQDVAAGESLVLDKFWFGGADAGMRLIVGTGTSLRPYFTNVPGYDSNLKFKDIAPRNIRQIELLDALGEMFNLVFYTDRTRKEVHIEPLEAFYEDGEEVDWSGRVDVLNGVAISDLGLGMPQNFVLTYLNDDKATNSFNIENNTTLGRWSMRNPLYGTTRSTQTKGNKLFTTTLNIANIVGCAPSASILQVGDIDSNGENMGIFTPRIVCYKGLQALPEGESWGATSRLNSYPYAAFLDEKSINLCFEERNGVEGLSRYYHPMLLRQCNSHLVTLDLYLTTAEMATLFTADGTKPSLRSRFRFNVLGESSLFRLAKVESWDTDSNIVRCSFERELND
ncbi:MAG: hypothetical protein E7129_06965 [Rikenellaceae bacterium]|nr:hypothetical protein [Rikenellaceae bacterium]